MEADCTSQGMGSSSSMSSKSQSLSWKHFVYRLGSAHLGTSWETTLSLSHELRGKCHWDTSLFSLFCHHHHQVWASEEQAEIIYKVLQDSKALGVPFYAFCQSFPNAHSEVTRPQSYIRSPGYPEQTSLQAKALSNLRRLEPT